MKPPRILWGDLHSHCNISYGHGSLQRALRSAREHLDFCSVTGHAFWPDMPTDRPRYRDVIRYHLDGFARLQRNWPEVRRQMAAYDEPGRFATLLSYEWHSLEFGDHNIYLLNQDGDLQSGATLDELERALAGMSNMIIPHHIGYGPGARGINWQYFDERRSPVVEVFSTHGGSERDGGPYPIYHTMGPRVHEGTVARGLELGRRFGFIAGTDHHGGYPGHYGGGLTAVLAGELTREAIWRSLLERRCYPVTGDRIALDFSVNDATMGAESLPAARRTLRLAVRACDVIDRVEVVKNSRPFYRAFGPLPTAASPALGRYKVRVEWGWGEKGELVDWNGAVRVADGEIIGVQPCFRGESLLDPRDGPVDADTSDDPPHAILEKSSEIVAWRSRTYGNPDAFLPGTSAIIIELQGNLKTRLHFDVNDRSWSHSLSELLEGSRRQSMRGWLSEALWVHRAVPERQYAINLEIIDTEAERPVDYYYLRVAQENNQWAWSSPIWVPRDA